MGSASAGGLATLVFDCDGVILNSNRIKTEAFKSVASRFGEAAADALVRFHVENGGVSRYRKFEYLLTDILRVPADQSVVMDLSQAYGECVYSGLVRCEMAAELPRLRRAIPHVKWMVVSGGDEAELRAVFKARQIDDLFDGGIYGSPATKDAILERERGRGNLVAPALLLGDSKYDYQAAMRAGLSFAFVRGWTEFREWRSYFHDLAIPDIASVGDVFDLLQLNHIPNS